MQSVDKELFSSSSNAATCMQSWMQLLGLVLLSTLRNPKLGMHSMMIQHAMLHTLSRMPRLVCILSRMIVMSPEIPTLSPNCIQMRVSPADHCLASLGAGQHAAACLQVVKHAGADFRQEACTCCCQHALTLKSRHAGRVADHMVKKLQGSCRPTLPSSGLPAFCSWASTDVSTYLLQ